MWANDDVLNWGQNYLIQNEGSVLRDSLFLVLQNAQEQSMAVFFQWSRNLTDRTRVVAGIGPVRSSLWRPHSISMLLPFRARGAFCSPWQWSWCGELTAQQEEPAQCQVRTCCSRVGRRRMDFSGTHISNLTKRLGGL